MKRGIKLIIVTMFLVGCTKSNVESTKTGFILKNSVAPIKLIEIDNCEYLYGDWGSASVLTHKGNCKFCLDRNNE